MLTDAVWQDDASATQCYNRKCRAKLGLPFGSPKHHCRFCGHIFCSKCAPQVPLPNGTPTMESNFTQARQCNWCRLPRIFIGYKHSPTATALEGRPMDLIMSFLDNRTINNYLQCYAGSMARFHIPNVKYYASLQERFPTLFDGAQIGKGGCGTVFTVEDRTRENQKVAVKVIRKLTVLSYATWRKILSEIGIMRDNDHPNVASLLEIFQTAEHLVMVMELGDGGSLKRAYEVMHKKDYNMEAFTAHVLQQVAAGLHYLHTVRSIVHRDIKQDNIVLTRDYSRVMIIDFGLAELLTSDAGAYVPCGTMGFASPENILAAVERKTRFRASRGTMFQSDTFSLGVVAHMMLSGRRPLKGNRFVDQWRECKEGLRCTTGAWRYVSPDARSLVERMLHISAEHRATPADVVASKFVKEKAPLFQAVEKTIKEENDNEDSDEEREWEFVIGRRGHGDEWGEATGAEEGGGGGRPSSPYVKQSGDSESSRAASMNRAESIQ